MTEIIHEGGHEDDNFWIFDGISARMPCAPDWTLNELRRWVPDLNYGATLLLLAALTEKQHIDNGRAVRITT